MFIPIPQYYTFQIVQTPLQKKWPLPEQPGVPGAAAAGSRGGDAVDAAAVPALERVAEVEDPVGSYGERAQPVVLDAVLDVAVAAAVTAVAPDDAAPSRVGQHRLRTASNGGLLPAGVITTGMGCFFHY